MSHSDPRPFLVLTSILDSAARPAAVTRSHGDALERALAAVANQDVAGLDLVELPAIGPHAFGALRKHFQMAPDTVALYDIFPLASHLDAGTRKLAGQFLASEVLWALSEQGLLGTMPFRPPPLDIPPDWDRDPKKLHERLLAAGALDLTTPGIETFKSVRHAWEASQPVSRQ